MKWQIKWTAAVCCICAAAVGLCGCSALKNQKKIVRIAIGQSETHPEYLGLVEFKNYVEEHLGEQYTVEIFPNELLGSTQKAIELTQTGAVDFTVAGTANLETFTKAYEIFSMPYLFESVEAYFETMENEEYMQNLYTSTEEAGFQTVTWYYVGTRNFYGKTPIHTPDDLKGKKIRVQQSPASIAMTKALGAAAAPMSFGEVYTAIQQGVIDGAENNELALTNNKHGEVAKYYSYTMHQMIPDMLIVNERFWEGLSEEEREIFKEAARLSTKKECTEWDKQVEEAKQTASEQMKVQFLEIDTQPFKEMAKKVQTKLLEENESIRTLYDQIQTVNKQTASFHMESQYVTYMLQNKRDKMQSGISEKGQSKKSEKDSQEE